MKKNIHLKVYRIFLIPYIVILLVCSFLAVGMYTFSFNIVEDEIINSNLNTFKQTKGVIDKRFEELSNMVFQISNNSKVRRLQITKNPYAVSEVYQVLSSTLNLYNYKLSNTFIDDYYVIFKSSDLVISSERAFLYDYFHENELFYKNYTASEIKHLLLDQFYTQHTLGVEPVAYINNDMEVLTYIHSLGNRINYSGAIIVIIDIEKIKELLESINLESGGSIIINDRDNNRILTLGNELGYADSFNSTNTMQDSGTFEYTANKEEMIVTYANSEINGWQYYAIQPRKVIVRQIVAIKRLILIVILAVILIGVLITFLYAYRKSFLPINHLIKLLESNLYQSNIASGNPLEYISNNLSNLIQDKELLEVRLREQGAVTRALFLQNLFHGQTEHESDISKTPIKDLISKESMLYNVFIAEFTFASNTPENLLVVNQYLQDKIDKNIIINTESNNRLVFLCSSSDLNKDDLNELISSTINSIQSYFPKYLIYFGIGTCCENIFDVNRPYEEALNALHKAIQTNAKEAVRYDLFNWNASYFYFPNQIEQSLSNWIRSGNQKEVKKILSDLYHINIFERNLSIKMQHIFLYELWSTIAKIEQTNDLEPNPKLHKIINMQSDENILQQYTMLTDLIMEMSNSFYETKKSHNDILIKKIKEYIEENIDDSSLGLIQLADTFQMNDTYLSNYFKEQTGQNFFEYLEMLRLEKAKELLKNTTSTIKKIAITTGYSSSNTFCRAFKRKEKLSPTQFRKQNQFN